MSENVWLNAPKTYALVRALQASHVAMNPGDWLYMVLLELARFEAKKAAEIVAEFQRANPITIELKTSDEARRVLEQVCSEEKETIKALADALTENALENGDDGPCWCGPVEKKNGRHYDTGCVRWRAALRLAGRLP